MYFLDVLRKTMHPAGIVPSADKIIAAVSLCVQGTLTDCLPTMFYTSVAICRRGSITTTVVLDIQRASTWKTTINKNRYF